MRSKALFASLRLVIAFLVITGAFLPGLYAQTNVSGNVEGTWTKAGSPYILTNSITIPAGKTLRIEPGVQVELSFVTIYISGTLVAEGTATDSIVFRGKTPTTNFTGTIIASETSVNSSFQYCRFVNFGWGSPLTTFTAMYVRTASCQVLNCNFQNIYGTAIVLENQFPKVSGNIFSTMYLDIIGRLDNFDAYSQNGKIKVGLRAGMTVDGRYPRNEFYRLMASLSIPAGRTLTLDPGVEVKFPGGFSQLNVAGTLIAEGTVADSIRFSGELPENSRGVTGPIIFSSTSVNNSLRYTSTNVVGYNTSNSESFPSGYAFNIGSASTTIANSKIYSPTGSGIFLDSVGATIRDNAFFTTDLDVSLTVEHLPKVTGNGSLRIGLWGVGSNATLTKDHQSYRLLKSITVQQGNTLTINPGVSVLFPLSTDLRIDGTLRAEGTVNDSVRFVGLGTFPAPGQSSSTASRGPIDFRMNSIDNLLKFVSVRNLGYVNPTDALAAVIIRTSFLTIENSSFREINGSGLSFDILNPQLNAFRPQVINSYFASLNMDALLTADNLFRLSGNNYMKIGLRPQMTADARLTTSYYYKVLSGLTVPEGINLTIDPGVTVNFGISYFASTAVNINGTLKAAGTVSQPIRFHGLRPNSIQDTYNLTLGFSSVSANNLLQYVTIDSFGIRQNTYAANYNPSVGISTASILMENCTLKNLSNCDLNLTTNNASPKIINLKFSNSDIDAITTLAAMRSFQQNSRPLRLALSSDPSPTDDTLSASNTLYRVLTTLSVAAARTLTIEPGVRIEFEPQVFGNGGMTINGTLLAQGTKEKPITFTKRTLYPSGYGYGPVTFSPTSKNSVFSYVNIEELGMININRIPALIIRSASCTFNNLSVSKSLWTAVSLETPGVTISNSCFVDNPYGAILSTSGSHQITNSNFIRNAAFGINNTSTNVSDTVRAINCWWGHISGPIHPQTNPTANGDVVSNKVLYTPWSTTVFECNVRVAAPEAPLPVTLTYFKGKLNGSIAEFNWQTATEINSSRFVLQRSVDGVNFINVATVPAKNNSVSLTNYSSSDPLNATGEYYYRLKMIDRDDRFEYSDIVVLRLANARNYSVYPNPVQSTLQIQMFNERQEKLKISVYDMNGRLKATQESAVSAGSNIVTVKVGHLAKGMYVLEIAGRQTVKKSFLKE